MIKNKINQKKMIHTAEELSKKMGLRWTDMRESVFGCILDQDKPITAYQMIEKLSIEKNKDIKPASVYRSLDALCELGLVVKIESLNAFMACAHPEHHHEHVFLVCRQCGNADELADHSVSKRLSTDAIHQGFKIEKQVLELQGSCRDCRA